MSSAPTRDPSATPPRGTQHKLKVKPKKDLPSASKRTPAQLDAIRKELKLLPDLVKKHYTKWGPNGATPFQLECMEGQALGKDIIVHAATGAGKTGIAAGPHLLPSSKGKVTLMISPLLSLHEEQVITFKEEFGLEALAINSAHGGCTKEITEVVDGEYQIVLLSPEMLLSRRFIDKVLRTPEFKSRCLSVFIDEAHCISLWGDSFRKKYGSIGLIRAFLPKSTPIVAVSATLTPRVREDIIKKLHMDPQNYLFVNIGNDRPAVAQVVRSMQHAMNSYRDLDFIVPSTMDCPPDVPKSFVYCDDTKEGAEIIDHLNARVCPEYRSRGLVRPYNASMSRDYRNHVMKLFKAGIIRILVCTDAAGMGCDLADVDIVIQWKAPANMSSWVQRAGRAARGKGRKGLAVMLVEKTAFETETGMGGDSAPVTNAASAGPRGGRGGRGSRGGRGGRGRGRGAKQGKDYAILHGQKRGWYDGKEDVVQLAPEAQSVPEIARDAPGEGLYIYIQTTAICRRLIMSEIFGNEKVPVVDPSECCDVCNARLFDRTRPSKPVAAVRQQAAKKGLVVPAIRLALYEWRLEIKKSRYSHTAFTSQAILDDDTCEKLASIGPITSKDFLLQYLSGWGRWESLGDNLLAFMQSLDIPPMQLPPKRPRVSQTEPQTASKRPRLADSPIVQSANSAPRTRTRSNAIAGPSTPAGLPRARQIPPQTPLPQPYYPYPTSTVVGVPRWQSLRCPDVPDHTSTRQFVVSNEQDTSNGLIDTTLRPPTIYLIPRHHLFRYYFTSFAVVVDGGGDIQYFG
ncbi:P-loop containing nucleoside triphosphate hydrolase protein [Mycena vulgaris]|nr:P-loop containing nucleoside triphosphate hydrolase protein [Mycena vulgaris]